MPARLGDIYELKPAPPHLRLPRLTQGLSDVDCWDPPARFVLTDELYPAPIAGGTRREFAIASGAMTDAEFLAFNEGGMPATTAFNRSRRTSLPHHILTNLIAEVNGQPRIVY